MARTIALCHPLVLLTLAACATTPVSPQSQAIQSPPSDDLRASLGAIGVVSVAGDPKVDQRALPTGPRFGSGALHGWGDWTRATHAGLWPADVTGLGFLVFIAGLPVAGVVGGANAEAKNYEATHSDGEADELETTFRKVLAAREPHIELRERVAVQAAMLTERKIIDIGSDRTVNPTKRAGYAPLVEKGAKTALEVGVRAITIMLENNAGDLYLTMTATGRSRLVEAATNQLLWFDEQIEVQTVSHHRLPDWKAGDDGMVKSEIDEGLDMLAREISHTVFLEGQVD